MISPAPGFNSPQESGMFCHVKYKVVMDSWLLSQVPVQCDTMSHLLIAGGHSADKDRISLLMSMVLSLVVFWMQYSLFVRFLSAFPNDISRGS